MDEKINEGYELIVKGYANLILTKVQQSDHRKRIQLFEGLERLLEGNTNLIDEWDKSKAQEIRFREGLSGENLGKEMGVSRQCICQYEEGLAKHNHSSKRMRYLL